MAITPDVFEIHKGRAHHAREIDAAVLVKVLVLGRYESIDDVRRHRLDGHENALFRRNGGHHAAVVGVNAGERGRLVVLEEVVIRQPLAVMLQDKQRPAGGNRQQQQSQRH